jgi:hypothetical protein
LPAFGLVSNLFGSNYLKDTVKSRTDPALWWMDLEF